MIKEMRFQFNRFWFL